MKIIRNVLAVVGLIAIVASAFASYKVVALESEFNQEAPSVYMKFFNRLLASKDPGVSLDYAVPVKAGISHDELRKSLINLAKQDNVLYTGEHPFYKQIEARTGKPYRYINFLSFCHPHSGQMVLDYQDAYSSFMPSRIAIVEDKAGKLWLHTMRLDLVIYGGKPLSPELKKQALKVWDTTRDMMDRAAVGDF